MFNFTVVSLYTLNENYHIKQIARYTTQSDQLKKHLLTARLHLNFSLSFMEEDIMTVTIQLPNYLILTGGKKSDIELSLTLQIFYKGWKNYLLVRPIFVFYYPW
jgi:hypothetical protein